MNNIYWEWFPKCYGFIISCQILKECWKYRDIYLLIEWLIDYLLFYVALKNVSRTCIWRRHHCRWRTFRFRPMLGAHGLWAGRDLYHATLAVTRKLSFSCVIRRTAPFSHLLRNTLGCGESILTWIPTGPHSVVSYDTQWVFLFIF
jgi:hypothetical protein